MDVRTLGRHVAASIRGRFGRWHEASRENAAKRTLYRASGGRGYPTREAAHPRSAPDGGLEAGGGGGNGG